MVIELALDGDRHHVVDAEEHREAVGGDRVLVGVDEVELGASALEPHDGFVLVDGRKPGVVRGRAVAQRHAHGTGDALPDVVARDDARVLEERGPFLPGHRRAARRSGGRADGGRRGKQQESNQGRADARG